AAVTPAESAPDWHVEPDATAEAHPTSALAPILHAVDAAALPIIDVMLPTALNAPAVTPARMPAFSACPRLPLVTPATNAADAIATGIAQAGFPPQSATAAT